MPKFKPAATRTVRKRKNVQPRQIGIQCNQEDIEKKMKFFLLQKNLLSESMNDTIQMCEERYPNLFISGKYISAESSSESCCIL